MKEKYRVALAVEIDGQVYAPGSTVELDAATAKLYNHALRIVEGPAAPVTPAAPTDLDVLQADAAKLAADIAAAKKVK